MDTIGVVLDTSWSGRMMIFLIGLDDYKRTAEELISGYIQKTINRTRDANQHSDTFVMALGIRFLFANNQVTFENNYCSRTNS